jgi:hypothetical protein
MQARLSAIVIAILVAAAGCTDGAAKKECREAAETYLRLVKEGVAADDMRFAALVAVERTHAESDAAPCRTLRTYLAVHAEDKEKLAEQREAEAVAKRVAELEAKKRAEQEAAAAAAASAAAIAPPPTGGDGGTTEAQAAAEADMSPKQRCTIGCLRENVPLGCIQSCGCNYLGFDEGYRWSCKTPEQSECAGTCTEADPTLKECLDGCGG